MSSNIDHKSICNICNKPFKDPQSFSCDHTFCRKCIIQWFEKNNTLCPTCGRSISINDVKDADSIVHNEIDGIHNGINEEHSKVDTFNSLLNKKSSQNEQKDQLYDPISSILLFEPMRSIFAEVFSNNQQVNDKTNQLEKKFHQEHEMYANNLQDINHHLNTFIDQYHNRVNKDQIEIDGIRTEHQYLNKQVDEQIIKCLELQNDNQFFKNKINQVEQQYQNYIKELENTNNHLNTCVVQLTDQLNSTIIQVTRIDDQYQQQIKKIHQFEQLKQQIDEQCIQYNELQNHNQIFKEQVQQLEQQYQQDFQTHTKTLDDKITQMNNQLNNHMIHIQSLEDENKQLKIQNQIQYEAYMEELKGTLYHQREQLKINENQIEELQNDKQKLQIQIDEQMKQYNKLLTDNQSLKEQIQQLEQQYQQADQIQIEEIENTNNRLNTFIEHMKKYSDDNKAPTSELHDEHEEQHLSNIAEIDDNNDPCNLSFTESSEGSEDNEISEILSQYDEHNQEEENIQLDEHEKQPKPNIKPVITRIRNILKMKQYRNSKLELKIQQQKNESQVYLKGQKLIDKDMDIIIKEAIIIKQCTWLYLSSNEMTSDCASILAKALNNNKTLERLYLSDNQISDDGVHSLVKVLSLNTNNLKALNLSKNGITEIGAKYLAEMIITNKTLTHLYLGDNEINDYGIQALANAIENYNTTIKFLDLSSNKLMTDNSIDALLQMIKNNQSINKLNIFNCHLSENGKQQLKISEQSKEGFKVCVNTFFD